MQSPTFGRLAPSTRGIKIRSISKRWFALDLENSVNQQINCVNNTAAIFILVIRGEVAVEIWMAKYLISLFMHFPLSKFRIRNISDWVM
jgi:hypothetical protein